MIMKPRANAAGVHLPVLAFAVLALLASPLLRPAHADAPPGRYVADSGTVLDSRTGRRWQQLVDGSAATETEARNYCSSLTLGRFTNGWHLPTVRELLTLVDPTRRAPAIDPVAFPGTPSSYFWSSSTSVYIGTLGGPWLVGFADGDSVAGPAGGGTVARVRCVR